MVGQFLWDSQRWMDYLTLIRLKVVKVIRRDTWGVSFHHGLNCLVRKEKWLFFLIKRENFRFIIEIVWLSPLYIYIQHVIHGCSLGVKRCFLSTGCRMLCLLDPTKVDDALALITDLSDNLEDRTLEVSHLHFVLHLTLLFRCLYINAGRYLKSSVSYFASHRVTITSFLFGLVRQKIEVRATIVLGYSAVSPQKVIFSQ